MDTSKWWISSQLCILVYATCDNRAFAMLIYVGHNIHIPYTFEYKYHATAESIAGHMNPT